MLNLVLALLSICLAFASQELLEAEQLSWSIGGYVVALGLALFAFRGQHFPGARLRTEPYDSPTPDPSTKSLLWLWIPLPLLIVALGCAGWALVLFRRDFERPGQAWWLYVISAFVFLVSTFLMQYFRQRAKEAAPDRRTHKIAPPPNLTEQLQWLVLPLILMGGIFMRLYRFDSLPFGTWYDEAVAVNLAQRILDDPSWRPVFPGAINVTGHYIYLVSRALALMDVPTLAVRSVSVVMGCGTVLAAYFAGREIFFGARTDSERINWLGLASILGVVVATFLAFSRWNVIFSRIGMYNIATPFFALLSIALVLRAARRKNYFEYGLAGLSIGLGLSFYTAFFFFVAALGLYLLYRIAFERGFLRQQWIGLTLMTMLIVMVAAPLAFFALDKPDVYFARTNETSLLRNTPADEQVDVLLESTRKHLLMFHYQGDPNGRHNLPGKPMLDSFSAALLLLGLGLCLRWIWRPTALLLLLWFLLALLGGILTLSFEAPQSLRSISAQPAAHLLAALPIYLLGQVCLEVRNKSGPWIFGAFLPLLLLPMAFENYRVYFNEQATDFASWNAFSTPETLAADLYNQIRNKHEGGDYGGKSSLRST